MFISFLIVWFDAEQRKLQIEFCQMRFASFVSFYFICVYNIGRRRRLHLYIRFISAVQHALNASNDIFAYDKHDVSKCINLIDQIVLFRCTTTLESYAISTCGFCSCFYFYSSSSSSFHFVEFHFLCFLMMFIYTVTN